ncbi:AAA family ATPase [Mycolicibacterium bacteremicum]|uniref:AAA family ATPase n=1 Tax=Mycolicibacterium bacteremicum TaxID=564198 RepID=UPI0013FD8662|nr:AAA family ATPase [Mycolicibacterium bacteremicum]MCV7435375.1 AAA family ATPase [Mycolicibacterium bacteremicum]
MTWEVGPIIGRAQLADLTARVAAGAPGAPQGVILVGEPGIGKSMLLRHAMAHAPDHVRLLFASGTEPDHVPPFTALAELIRPLGDLVAQLPPTLRDALHHVLDVGVLDVGVPDDGSVPGPASIQQAVLALLGISAATAPLMLVLDDFDRFEPDSRQVLSYVVSRVPHLAVRILASARHLDRVRGLDASMTVADVPALSNREAAQLIEAQSVVPHPSVTGEIIRWSAGNPLALIESARFYGRSGADVFRVYGMVGGGFARALFATQLAELPADARRLVIFAATGAGYEDIDLLTAAAGFGAQLARWDPAVAAGIVTVAEDRRVRFGHPLLRSIAYAEAGHDERTAAHTALAASPMLDDFCRAWHLAAAATAPDEGVAVLLEQGAARSGRRGGYLEVARALQRAGELSPDDGDAARRFMLAAAAANFGGDPAWAQALTGSALHRSSSPQIVGQAALTRASILVQAARPAEAFDVVGGVLDGTPFSDSQLRLNLLYVAASAAYYSGDPAERSRLRGWLAGTAGDTDAPSAFPMPLPPEAGPLQRAHIAMYADTRVRPVTWDRRWLQPMSPAIEPYRRLIVGEMAYVTEDTDLAVAHLRAAVEGLNATGGLRGFTYAMAALAWSLLDTGRWAELNALLAETESLCAVYDLNLLHTETALVRAQLSALTGDIAAAEAALGDATRMMADKGGAATAVALSRATGWQALARGDFDTAYRALRQMFDPDGGPVHFVVSHRGIADLAWTGVRSGHSDDLRSLITTIGRQFGSRPPVRLRLLRHQALALTASTGLAERHHRLAVTDPAGQQWPLERARAQLHYGEWLRRVRRPAQARTQLGAALEQFELLGALPLAQMARAELRAAGVTGPARHAVAGLDALTAQERQIVTMAASGLTNREIGLRVHLSPRTVASHLYKVYPKLGVTRRHQLRDILGDQT